MLNRICTGLKWRARLLRETGVALIVRMLKESTYRYCCPVCRRRVGAFNPMPSHYRDTKVKHGGTFRPDLAETCNYGAYSCTACGASDRSRLYALYMKKLFADYSNRDDVVIIHFAPCRPLQRFIEGYVSEVPQQWKCLTSDLMMDGVDVKADICCMPQFDEQSFDFFICSHMLEHVVDDCAAMRELFRILRKGGSGIVMVPILLGVKDIDEDPTVTDIGERWRRFGQDDHVRRYSKAGFVQRLQDAGFRVEQLGIEYFGSKAFRRSGISRSSVLYVVHRDS